MKVLLLWALLAAARLAHADGSTQPSVQQAEAASPEVAATPAESGSDPSIRSPFMPRLRRLPLGLAFRAARPWSFTATLSPVLLGTALAFKVEDKFRSVRLVLSLIVTLSVHAAGNLMNTYFDHKNGVDNSASSDTTLVNGQLAPSQVASLGGWAYAIAVCAAAPLPFVSR